MTADRSGRAARHLVLLGMMGAGKTTLARALGQQLGWPVHDNDVDLAARTGRTGADLAVTDGVQALHAMEARLLLDALAAPPPTIIAAAASVTDTEACRVALSEQATTIWLDAPAEELARRRAAGRHRRLIDSPTAQSLDARRRVHLADLADLHLDARQPPSRLVAAVAAHVTGQPEP